MILPILFLDADAALLATEVFHLYLNPYILPSQGPTKWTFYEMKDLLQGQICITLILLRYSIKNEQIEINDIDKS